MIYLYLIVYLAIEASFLIANLEKFLHGGYVTINCWRWLIRGYVCLVPQPQNQEPLCVEFK